MTPSSQYKKTTFTELDPSNTQRGVKELAIVITTWKNESHGLFDYSSKDCLINEVILNRSSSIHLSDDSVLCEFQGKALNKQKVDKLPWQFLLELSLCKKAYQVHANRNDMWLIVKETENSVSKVEPDDLLRFGRLKFLVRELCLAGQNMGKLKARSLPSVDGQCSGNDSCRICLGDRSLLGNPLVSLCKCSGKQHVLCLGKWLASKRSESRSKNIDVFTYRSFQCEVCKHPYEPSFQTEGRSFDLLAYEKPKNSDYLVLQSVKGVEAPSVISLYVIKFSQLFDVCLIGRGLEADLRLNDISISRIHAKLKHSKGKITLMDLYSKFGTLKHCGGVIALKDNEINSFQVGRNAVHMTTNKSMMSLFKTRMIEE